MFILDAELSKRCSLKLEMLKNTIVNGNKNKNTDIKQVKNALLKLETLTL